MSKFCLDTFSVPLFPLSQLQLDHFGNWRIDRVLCQLYAHLIGILLTQRLTSGWMWRDGHELSLCKCVQLIQGQIDDLMKCIARDWWGAKTWVRKLEGAFLQFGRKTKRKKHPLLSNLNELGLILMPECR